MSIASVIDLSGGFLERPLVDLILSRVWFPRLLRSQTQEARVSCAE